MRNSYSEEGFLNPKSPFDFSKSLDFLRDFPPMRDDQKIDELSLTRARQSDSMFDQQAPSRARG
jgi:hypothetical protein